MQKRTIWGVCLLTLCVALGTIVPAQSQMAAKDKPPVYTYVATWDVPRAQWADMAKVDEQDKPLMEKLVADGVLVGYGTYVNVIHQEGEPTNGSWFTATSEGNLLKALEEVYKHPSSVAAPVQGASKHWDQILTGDIYNAKPGASAGYLTWSKWEVKPGQMHAYRELTKTVFVPVLEKLLAEGTITSYGQLREDYHSGKLGVVYDYITVPDAASLDKANKAFEDAFSSPAVGDAMRALTEGDGHRDYLTRVPYMFSK
jgi:hypothetical protein